MERMPLNLLLMVCSVYNPPVTVIIVGLPLFLFFCLWQCCFHLFARVLSDILMFLWKSYLIWFHTMDLNMKQWLWNMQCENKTLSKRYEDVFTLWLLWMFIVIYVSLYLVKPRNSEKYLLENCIRKHHQISMLNIKYSIFLFI